MAETAPALKCRLCIDSITRRDFTPGDPFRNLKACHEAGPEQADTGALESLTSAHRLRDARPVQEFQRRMKMFRPAIRIAAFALVAAAAAPAFAAQCPA